MPHAPVHAFAAALLLQGCVAVNSREACQVTKLAEIPIQVINNRPIVDVSFGDRPARLMLDTGATHTVLTDAAFSRLGLNYDLNMTVTSTGAAGDAVARISQPVSVTVGGLRLPPKPVISIQSATALDAKSGIDGLLGVDALSAQDLDIDMPHRTLGLYAARQCPDGPAPFGGPSVRFKSAANPYGYLYVPALADGHALSLIVDTGATGTYLNQRHLGLSDASIANDNIIKAASSGPGSVAARVHLFRSITLGDTSLRNARLWTGSMPFEQDGLLGTDFWRSRRVWLSFAGWTTTIQRLTPN